MSQSPTSPSGGGSGGGSSGGGFFTRFIINSARNAIENALNSTANAAGSGSVQASRSFFDFGGIASDSPDGWTHQVMEYSGRQANTEIASIYPISLRAGDLILHGPRKDPAVAPTSASYLLYNIILHSTNSSGSSEKMYSLFRTDSEQEASRVFVIYKQIFPDLVKASASTMDKQMLDKIIKLSLQNESFQAVHIAAALGMAEQLKSPALREKLSEQEGKMLRTPLQVACVYGKLDAVKAICEDTRQLNRVYDYTDSKGNSIVHLAADCYDNAVGAAVLKLLKEKLLQQSGPQRESVNRTLLELFGKVNNEGHTPLHLACMHTNKEAAEELTSVDESRSSGLKTQSTCLDVKDPATGNTPLHFSTTEPELLSHLLASGSDPNITNNEGLTPLHKAVVANHLKSTLQLLSNNAFADFKATYDTFIDATPLHMAAAVGAIDVIKALIVFGADLNMQDGHGHTARHIVASVYNGNSTNKSDALFVLAAAGAKRCSTTTGNCSDGCKAGGKYEGKRPENWRINKDGTTSVSGGPPEALIREAMRGLSICRESFDAGANSSVPRGNGNGPVVGGRLLSLDGGGIRGLVLTQILFFMEKEFANMPGGGDPIVSYFDWVAGTSTGGILALALASGKSVLETQSLYMKLKDKVFTGSRPYSAARMEEFLKLEFGADRKMSSIQKPRVMIMTALANRRPPDLYIYRNYMSPSSLLQEPEEYSQVPENTYIWKTAKVTGAAPSYFTLDDEDFIDGGLISNNPTLDALSELVQFKAVMMGSQQCDGWKLPALVLSLGTGIPPKEMNSARNLDIAWPTGVFEAVRNVPRLTQLVNLLVDQATQAEGQVVERARAWCASIGVPFFRFSPEMGEDIGLDEKQDDVVVNLMWETWCYMVGHRTVVREIFERLRELDITNPDSRRNNGRTEVSMDTQ